MRRLVRYTDRERVLNILDVDAVEGLPNQFFAKAEGHTACRVTVDWLGIKDCPLLTRARFLLKC